MAIAKTVASLPFRGQLYLHGSAIRISDGRTRHSAGADVRYAMCASRPKHGVVAPMTVSLKDLILRYAQPGQITWIGLRPARRAPLLPVEEAEVTKLGLVGDRGSSTKRAVTLVQAEHLPVVGALLGRGPVTASDLRRNLVVSGLNLAALKGRSLRIGTAVLEITTICAPCSRMEETFGPGGYSAVRGHGGYCARVVSPGLLRIGDAVLPLTTETEPSL